MLYSRQIAQNNATEEQRPSQSNRPLVRVIQRFKRAKEQELISFNQQHSVTNAKMLFPDISSGSIPSGISSNPSFICQYSNDMGLLT